MRLGTIGAAALAALTMTTGAAFARPDVHLTTSGYVVAAGANGSSLKAFSDSVAPRSGDTIELKVVARNQGSEGARRFTTTLPIAPQTAYIGGSAMAPAGVEVAFSIDGKTFSARPMLAVKTPQGIVMKPADPSAYTAVRWTDSAVLAANASATFAYEAKVK